MTARHIIIMLEAYFFMLFCVPLPVLCVGNAAGLAVTALLIILTVHPEILFGAAEKLADLGFFGELALALIIAAAVFAVILAAAVSVKMAAAARRRPEKGLPYTVIILGCRVRGDRPSRMLRRRLNAAYEYLKENPSSVCVVSGGKGRDERISEAEAMKKYLLGLGLDGSRIFEENRSTSTLENLKFSKEIILSRGLPENIAAATDRFHQYRASLLAERLGMKVRAVSAATEPRYAPTYWVREWFGIAFYKIRSH